MQEKEDHNLDTPDANLKNVAVIGGGAAGFFAALTAKTNFPDARVVLFEKTGKLLSKVKVSGGGRCNVTNANTSISELAAAYPRGEKFMKKALRTFSTPDIRQWFEARGVQLKVEPDGRVFPVTDNSQTIIDCLLLEAGRLQVEIDLQSPVTALSCRGGKVVLTIDQEVAFDKVILATGGSPKRSGLAWLETLGHRIEEPVPSLFTFNMPDEAIIRLMGVVAPDASVRIQGEKLKSEGPLLITHWGMSGPAILRLSAFGARLLAEKGYQFQILVNWVNASHEDVIRDTLKELVGAHPQKQLSNLRPFGLPERLWVFLLERVELPPAKTWNELGKKGINRLTNVLFNDTYSVSGKTTFKEEFVTCGGVSLKSIDPQTMQSKVCPNLYFAGEVLDIDGITGGYNFQAAWTTGFIAGQLG